MQEKQQLHIPLLVTLLIAPCLICGTLAYLPVAVHNVELDRFSRNLYNHPLPPQTTVVSKDHNVSLRGNGNHCDFYAEQVMSTKLSHDEIEDFYRGTELPGIGIGQDKVFLSVSFDEYPFTSGERIFKIYILDFGNPTNLDYRCH